MDILFLKIDVHAYGFQLADRGKRCDGVAGKPADGFGKDHVDLPCTAIREQSLKLCSAFLCAGDGFICIHAHVLPAVVGLDETTVLANLRFKGIESHYTHELVWCKCKSCYVDGGKSYLRRGFKNSPDDYTELSETVLDDSDDP